jgi:hypothetical protein
MGSSWTPRGQLGNLGKSAVNPAAIVPRRSEERWRGDGSAAARVGTLPLPRWPHHDASHPPVPSAPLHFQAETAPYDSTAKRAKTHWDHVLEEVEWLAKEFIKWVVGEGWRARKGGRFPGQEGGLAQRWAYEPWPSHDLRVRVRVRAWRAGSGRRS